MKLPLFLPLPSLQFAHQSQIPSFFPLPVYNSLFIGSISLYCYKLWHCCHCTLCVMSASSLTSSSTQTMQEDVSVKVMSLWNYLGDELPSLSSTELSVLANIEHTGFTLDQGSSTLENCEYELLLMTSESCTHHLF